MQLFIDVFFQAWRLLSDASIYILFGLLISGLLRVFFSPYAVAQHLGHGKFLPVLKAALIGIPLPLCSCGVLPAAVALKKQGANNGATTAFLIATPESGVDSIAITYALLDPIMTIVRPLAAFVMAAAAGIAENLMNPANLQTYGTPDLSCPVDGCCSGVECSPAVHRKHHTLGEKLVAGFKFAFNDVWRDMVGWFFIGIMLAGLITALIPNDVFQSYLGGGLPAMLLMLFAGIPLYICATASTPIAAALILKGVSPGAALVFLLAGPATNIAALTVLVGILGRRATAIYLATIAGCTVGIGLLVDRLYHHFGLSAQALVGHAADLVPFWVGLSATIVLIALSVKPLWGLISSRWHRTTHHHALTDPCPVPTAGTPPSGCSGAT
jgi:uncharacterized membrane protein YraQ (UPF0718 family)